MKKILTIALTLMLIFALALPTFASSYNGHELPEIGPIERLAILRRIDTNTYLAYILPSAGAFHKVTQYSVQVDCFKYEYHPDTNEWKQFASPDGTYEWIDYESTEYMETVFIGFDVISNGQVLRPADTAYIPDMCDGTSCPATDANLDNICDDCGKVLTMSLRNPLLDYARSLALGKAPEYPYYAIFASGDTYYVHISKNPMSSPDGVVLTGDGIMYNRVSQSADGVNGGSGWYNGFYQSYDSFVESNHTISNFKPALPMAEAIMGVTEEQMAETLPELGRTAMIILLCGVGCLALLILLSLLVKVFGRFRKG